MGDNVSERRAGSAAQGSEAVFVPIGRWPAPLAIGLSGFLRWSKDRRGCYRVRRLAVRWARWLLGGRHVPVRYYEGHLWVDPASRLDVWIFVDGEYEGGTVDLIRRASRAGWSFVDVGANLGDHSLPAAFVRTSRTQRFSAFEPDPRVIGVLRQNIERNGLASIVDTFPFALAARASVASLNTAADSDASYLTAAATPDTIEIETRTLDAVLGDDYPVNVVMKVDVEGAELDVLEGARGFLEHRPDAVLIVEFNPIAQERAGRGRLEVLDRIRSLGLRVWRIDETTATLVDIDPATLPFCNLLAARERPPFC